jgi:hypothetical protein
MCTTDLFVSKINDKKNKKQSISNKIEEKFSVRNAGINNTNRFSNSRSLKISNRLLEILYYCNEVEEEM